MISLYESILGDIYINIAASDDAAVMLSANAEGSKLREFLDVSDCYNVSNPFDINGNTLTVLGSSCKVPNRSSYAIWLHWKTDEFKNDTVNDILGTNIKRIETNGSIRISGSNMNNLSDRYAREIKASTIKIAYPKNTVIKDLSLNAGTHKMANIIPSMFFSGDSPLTLKNVDLNIDAHTLSRINFTKLPIFKNVSSNMDRIYVELHRDSDPVINEDDVFEDPRYNDLFDFGYSIKYELDGKVSTAKVKDMKSLKTMVTTSSFYKRRYEKFPYRLKPNVKLNDIIDVTKWPNLEEIIIQGKKMYIAICKQSTFNKYRFSTYYHTLLKKENPTLTIPANIYDEFIKNVPVTSDGWYVFVNRY